MKCLLVFTNFVLYNLTSNNDYFSDKAKRELGYFITEIIVDVWVWLKEEKKYKNNTW